MDARRRLDEILDILLRIEPAHPADEDLPLRDPQRCAHCRAACGIEGL